jgi:predicted flap endonuclease-1-like 5' DNA nuclease
LLGKPVNMPTPKSNRTKVKEIFHKGSASIVEWVDEDNNINRVVVPSSEVVMEKGEAYVEDVGDGQPYGVDWETLIHTKMGPKAIANLLHKNGIWTFEDYAQNTRVITSVFNEACSANLQSFRENVLKQGRND